MITGTARADVIFSFQNYFTIVAALPGCCRNMYAKAFSMRRDARVDANQKQITEELRAVGCSVQPLHHVGQGCPDLLVGHAGKNYLFEIKNPDYNWEMTDAEEKFFSEWRGQCLVIVCLDDALRELGLL